MSGLRRYFVFMEVSSVAIAANSMNIVHDESGTFICFYIDGVLIANILDTGVQEVLCDGETVYQAEGRGIYELQNAIE